MDLASHVLVTMVILLGLSVITLAFIRKGSYSDRRHQQAGFLLSPVISRNEIVLSSVKGEAKETWLFAVDAGARLTLDGQPAYLRDLNPGDILEVFYVKQVHRRLALEIVAQRNPQAFAALPSGLTSRAI